jgi:hypothetical protein
LQQTQLHCCTGGSSRKTVLAGNENVLVEVPHALRGTNFRVSPPVKGPSNWVAEARPLWLSWASLSISSVAVAVDHELRVRESSICSSKPRHAVVVRVNNSLHLTHAEHSNNSKDMYPVFYLHTSKLQSLDISLVFVKDIVNAPAKSNHPRMSTVEVELMDQNEDSLMSNAGPPLPKFQ